MVGAPTAVYFSVTTLNPVPSTGGLQIKFPKWNSKASALVRESFILDELAFDIEDLPDLTTDADEDESSDVPIDYAKLCSPKRVSRILLALHPLNRPSIFNIGRLQ